MTRDDAQQLRPGDPVVYVPTNGPREDGTVVRVGERYVFVCYGRPGTTPKGTAPEDLERP